MNDWYFPIKDNFLWPDKLGKFGAVRKFDIHTGVDLYCDSETPIYAAENGVVECIENFTGTNAGSPWWNDTKAVLIKGQSGIICYGEIKPKQDVIQGVFVKRGSLIGNVVRVLKKDKGRPMSMLHIELYKSSAKGTVIWNLNSNKPYYLLDPTKKLKDAFISSYKLAENENAALIKENSLNLFNGILKISKF